MKIVLFEDTGQAEQALIQALTRALGDRGQAEIFRAPPREGPCLYEVQLERDLIAAGQDSATLIVADKDLSKLNLYGGLSEPTVRRVADKLYIPECAYARGEREQREFLGGPEIREGRIEVTLEHGEERFAEQVVAVAQGFVTIRDRLPEAIRAPRKKSPGSVLATLLLKPAYAEKIALYASGDQNRLAGVLQVRGTEPAERYRRLACLLGYWLWDSVLRFPGVVVNEVAASSYLNIEEGAFRDEGIRRIFERARYDGPFALARGPLWWRGSLDDVVAEGEALDGRELASRTLGREIAQSRCCEEPNRPAGYYCMLSGRPVSLENSRNGLTWFPRGADLARISNSTYEEVVPWLVA
jgi:hypothetical protein